MTLLDAALQYAGRGWRIFPLHWPIDSACSCGKADCASPAKHPLVKRGFHAAVAIPGTIERWWRKWPQANIGIATGRASGLVVIDIDGPDGLDTLRRLSQQHGGLPRTQAALTGSGWHLYYAYPEEAPIVPCSSGDGLDVRGNGGYVVAPPSRHINGNYYEWFDMGAGWPVPVPR